MAQKGTKGFRILTSPDDVKEIKKKVRRLRFEKIRTAIVPAVLILLAVCGTYLLLKNQEYGHARVSAQYSSDISDTSNYAQFADGIVRYNRDGIVFLNKKNEEQWIQPAQIQNPVIEVKENAFAVADNGGNTIMVFSEEGLKGEIETPLPIEKIAISDQGIVSVILKNENSPKIMSYDAAGNILVEQQVQVNTTGYPVAVDISDDGNVLAVSYLSIEGAAIKSKIVYYNFSSAGKEKPDNIVTQEEYQNTIMTDIFFMKDNTSVAVGDNCFAIYNGKDVPDKIKEVKLDQEIQSVFHSKQYIGFILLNREKSGYELRLYNRRGDQIINRELPGMFSHAKIEGDEVVMWEGSRCCIVTVTDIIKFNGDIKMDALEIFRAPGLNRYYVMSIDELRVVHLMK